MTQERLNEMIEHDRKCVKALRKVVNKIYVMTADEIDNAIKELFDKDGIYIPRYPDLREDFDLCDYYYNRDYLAGEIDDRIKYYEEDIELLKKSKPEDWVEFDGSFLDFMPKHELF